jgi:hypothetical protein
VRETQGKVDRERDRASVRDLYISNIRERGIREKVYLWERERMTYMYSYPRRYVVIHRHRGFTTSARKNIRQRQRKVEA